MSASAQTLGTALLSLTLIALASFVLLHNRHAPVNRRFALAAFAIAAWTFTIPSALSAHDPKSTVILGRSGFAFASAIPFTLLRMFLSFRTADDRSFIPGPAIRSLVRRIHVLLALAMDSFWRNLRPHEDKLRLWPSPSLFGLYFLLSFVLALYTLWTTTRAASGLRKLQLRYLLLGVLLGGSGAITTNLLIPLIAGTSSYSALGPYFSLLVVSFSAHAIIRYRLMDIRVVFKTGVVYICAIAAGPPSS